MAYTTDNEVRDGNHVKVDGKTFWDHGDNRQFTREHDENFHGPRFDHSRCPFCQRITSRHTLHWLNHTYKCAPLYYRPYQLMEMQLRTVDEIHHVDKSFIRKMK